jgi:hypothetical protein
MKAFCIIGIFAIAVSVATAVTPAATPSANASSARPAPTTDNPYSPIVTRNAFGLVPIPVVDPATLAPPTPPPKIAVNGIMNVFGQMEVLFKVAQPAQPGQPPKEISYTMGEGERQDDITVIKIDEQAGVVTFDNHGQPQTLELSKAAASGGGVPVPAATAGAPQFKPNPAFAATTASGNGTTTVGFGARAARNRAAVAGTDATTGATTGTATAGTKAAAQPAEAAQTLTPEEQIISIETQRAKMLDEGNPAAAILPPTPITKQVTGEEEIPAPPAPGAK